MMLMNAALAGKEATEVAKADHSTSSTSCLNCFTAGNKRAMSRTLLAVDVLPQSAAVALQSEVDEEAPPALVQMQDMAEPGGGALQQSVAMQAEDSGRASGLTDAERVTNPPASVQGSGPRAPLPSPAYLQHQ